MKGNSHRALGEYLAGRFLTEAAPRHTRAFLLGCVEPDHNPSTYLKGSIRSQWLHGHNWGNSECLICRFSNRLERRRTLHLWDYYTLGKLVHYTADAFTSVHNAHFSAGLRHHRMYEKALQNHFLQNIDLKEPGDLSGEDSLFSLLCSFHAEYSEVPSNIYTDTHYVLSACSAVVALILRSSQPVCGKL